MGENIDTPFLLLWSCKGSSNCLYLDQAVLHVRCLPWLRTESWSTKKNGRHHVIGSPSRPRAPKSIEDDVIGHACAVMGLEDDSSVWSYPPAHTTTKTSATFLLI